jgi:hypothetical protein
MNKQELEALFLSWWKESFPSVPPNSRTVETHAAFADYVLKFQEVSNEYVEEENSYVSQRRQRLYESVCEYLEEGVPNQQLLKDLTKCLNKEREYFLKQADKANTISDQAKTI